MISDPLPPAADAPAPEDAARAAFYALLARLYTSGPDEALLHAIATSPPLGVPPTAAGSTAGDGDRALASCWDALRAASAAGASGVVGQEYDDLFVGVGRSEINLHASHWLTGFMMERPLAEVRTTLAELGLARMPDVAMVEDHLAAMCETMRLLIAGDATVLPAALPVQKRFFERHLAPWVFACCAAIASASLANYYRAVAQFTDHFLALERDAFAME